MEERRQDYLLITKQLGDLQVLAARIEERGIALVERLDKINGSIAELWEIGSDTRKRVSMLERWRSALAGAWAATVGAVGIWLKIR